MSEKPQPTSLSLHEQRVVFASPSTKIRLSILATAMVDALGGPAEFQSRFSFPLVTTMMPNDNFSLPSGVWTDDTSMTLCLARSIATCKSQSQGDDSAARLGGFDEKDQLDAYARWYNNGVLSATDRCFDIGNTISRALHIYARHRIDAAVDIEKALNHIRRDLSKRVFAGNGSLMRVLPVGLAYWKDETQARRLARRSSATTHPTSLCLEACEVWTGAITLVMNAATANKALTKLDLLHYFAQFPYTESILHEALATPHDAPTPPSERLELERYYWNYHPILRLVAKMPAPNFDDHDAILNSIPLTDDLPSSGYVLHTLVAALYCFVATWTFEQGAIMAVNLGNDADTVGAIYGGLAGCWYSCEESSRSGRFWTKRVKEWLSSLVKTDLLEGVANELANYAQTTNDNRMK